MRTRRDGRPHGADRDKKNLHGSLNLILLDEIGKSRIYPTSTGFFPLERTI